MSSEMVPYEPEYVQPEVQYIQMPQPNHTGRNVLIGLAVTGVAGYVIYRIILNIRAKEAARKTYDANSPESYAQRIRMALENNNMLGWGTDNISLRQALVDIPSKDFMRKVDKAYAKLNKGGSMMMDIKSDLKTGEYLELLGIISGKPEKGDVLLPQVLNNQLYASWAKRIQGALDDTFLIIIDSVDKDALYAVIDELPTKASWLTLQKVYKALIGPDLLKQLKDRLRFYYYNEIINRINKKP